MSNIQVVPENSGVTSWLIHCFSTLIDMIFPSRTALLLIVQLVVLILPISINFLTKTWEHISCSSPQTLLGFLDTMFTCFKYQQLSVILRNPVYFIVVTILCSALLLLANTLTSASPAKTAALIKKGATSRYPEHKETLTTKDCMQCHPTITTLLRTRGARHSRVECRQCHLEFHNYVPGKTNYNDILPKCSRCHAHPHGDELVQCSGCHQEAHAPLAIPASRALSQGCYVCHATPDKEIKTFTTRHTDLYCTACHHTKHGLIPDCLECHKKHTGTIPTPGKISANTTSLDQCTSCHPPHKVLKVAYSETTPNGICGYCHRKASEMLERRETKHSRLTCTRCHPDQHKTIKRCTECHGRPHPEEMLKKFSPCGSCHGVAHSVVR